MMDHDQLLIAAIVIVGMVTFIVGSSRTELPRAIRRPRREQQVEAPQSPAMPDAAGAAAEQQAYRSLVTKAQGDHSLVERLVKYEQKRDAYSAEHND